jgi:hypothetical protein
VHVHIIREVVMSSARIAFVVAAFTVPMLLLVGAARPSASESGVAEKYFGCPSGYTFQVSGSNARCYLAGTQQTANIVCGTGYVVAQDQFSGYRDGCQAKWNNVLSNYTCPSGYSANVRPGPDTCVKSNPPSIVAPAIEKLI